MKQGSVAELPMMTVTFSVGRSNVGETAARIIVAAAKQLRAYKTYRYICCLSPEIFQNSSTKIL